MSLFFGGRVERRAMTSWVDANGFRVGESASNATHLGPVFAALRHIIDFGSTLPLQSFRRVDDLHRSQVPTPRLLARLDEPGAQGLEQWLGQIFYSLAAHGNAVGWVTEQDGWGYPLGVTWLGREDWSWDSSGKRWLVFGAPVPFERVVHIPWLVPSGKRLGLSPIEHYATITQAGLSAQEYADMKRGGGLPPVILKNKEKTIDAQAAEAVSGRLSARLAQGKPFVHGRDWDLTVPTIPPNHAQFIETLKLSANQIAAIYGIDPTEVGGEAANSLTYSTEELRQIRRAADMRPWLVRVERAIARMLPNKTYVQFNVDATVRVDIKTRVEVESKELDMGTRSVNEIRALEDRSPVPGGDFYNVPAPKQGPTSRKGES